RKIAEVMAIYRTLSMGDALLPPALAFLFDREGRSDKEIDSATLESHGKVRFLPCRMMENYFLRPDLLARLFNEVGAEHSINTTEDEVSRWLAQNGGTFCAGPRTPAVYSREWIAKVDGAALLERLFEDLSGVRLDYRKTRDAPRLAVLLHTTDPAASRQIIELVADVVE